jgi:CheY-like chemotaxis protein
VLVVDDNRDAAEVLAEALRLLGHDPCVAFDGAEALDVLVDFRPEVALLDLGLPAMDGYELARRIRDALGAGGVKLVAITGYGQEADRRLALEVGFDVHLIKPIDFSVLDELVAGAPAPDARGVASDIAAKPLGER